MAFSINDIKANFTYGGARPTNFSVQFANPASGTGDVKLPFLCRAAALPASEVGNIQIGYFGRKMNLAGDRTYAPWRVTVLNDEDFLIRQAMETWSSQINTFEGNLRTFGTASPLLYKTDAVVTQYDKLGNTTRQYTLFGCYPQDISAINLDWNTTDTVEEFDVTLYYDFFQVTGGSTGTITN